MPANSQNPQPIVPADLFDAAQAAIQRAKQDTRYPHLLDAKLGDAEAAPITDAQLASTYDTSLSSLNRRVAEAVRALRQWASELAAPPPPEPFNCRWTAIRAVLCQNVPGGTSNVGAEQVIELVDGLKAIVDRGWTAGS